MEISTHFIGTKYNSKVGYYADKYKNKSGNLNLDENKEEYLTLDEFCVELPLLIESSKKEGNQKNNEYLKSKNKRIEDLLR